MTAASSLDRALARLRLLTPAARFFQSGEVEARPTQPGEADHSFHYVSLYEHRIGNHVRTIGDFTFIIANGFVTSHAYNIALSWLWHRGTHPNRVGLLDSSLRHNYKKFFAERAVAQRSCLIGRAMLLETLIYEQDLMKPMFDAVAGDNRLGKLAADIASTTSRLASLHELCHLFLRRSGEDLATRARSEFAGALEPALATLRASYGSELAEEVRCDAFAAHQTVASPDSPLAGYDPLTRARITAFVFLVFSDLIALQESAIATAEAAESEDETAIDLESEKRPRTTFGFKVGRLLPADLRATTMIDLLKAYMERIGVSLFGDDGDFPFPASTREDLLRAFDRFGDVIEPTDGGMTGTDHHRRGLAQLVAESLHGHPDGAQFLLWRSKRFSVGGTPIDP